ncbi:MAG: hypothetical protein E3J56_08255 [Candidatus Aminicenantes bacterium]|nr:MAG: hypothetical protein E3J56_08255 [Candidatus Aminicenantes bacterium]
MPKELCPLLLAMLPKASSKDMAQCVKNDCMWFHQTQDKDPGIGLCAISRIGFSLAGINRKIQSM